MKNRHEVLKRFQKVPKTSPSPVSVCPTLPSPQLICLLICPIFLSQLLGQNFGVLRIAMRLPVLLPSLSPGLSSSVLNLIPPFQAAFATGFEQKIELKAKSPSYIPATKPGGQGCTSRGWSTCVACRRFPSSTPGTFWPTKHQQE